MYFYILNIISFTYFLFSHYLLYTVSKKVQDLFKLFFALMFSLLIVLCRQNHRRRLPVIQKRISMPDYLDLTAATPVRGPLAATPLRGPLAATPIKDRQNAGPHTGLLIPRDLLSAEVSGAGRNRKLSSETASSASTLTSKRDKQVERQYKTYSQE